jgi:hypothetical protein
VNLVAKCARIPYVDREVPPHLLDDNDAATTTNSYAVYDSFHVPALGSRQVKSSDKDERIFQFTVVSARHSPAADIVTFANSFPNRRAALLVIPPQLASEYQPKRLGEVNL